MPEATITVEATAADAPGSQPQGQATGSQPQSVVIEQAPAKSAAKPPEGVPEKFWDAKTGQVKIDALVRSYGELEKRLGGKPEEAGAEERGEENAEEKSEDKPTETPKFFVEEKAPEATEWEEKTYGKALAGIFSETKLDAKAVSDHWHQTGEFPEDAYAALEAKGVSRDAVNSYLAGVKASAADPAEAAQADTARIINDAAGGQEQFGAMVEWAKTAWSPEQVEAYNKAVAGGPEAAEMAVRMLAAEYRAENGSEPSVKVRGEAPRGETQDVFRSHEEVVRAMSKRDANGRKMYGVDPAYTRAVEAKIARSSL